MRLASAVIRCKVHWGSDPHVENRAAIQSQAALLLQLSSPGRGGESGLASPLAAFQAANQCSPESMELQI